MTTSATQEMGRYVEGLTLESVPPVAVRNAKAAILDVLGVTLAATRDPVGADLLRYADRADSSGPATVVGRGPGAGVELAALVNGSLAHALDFDDRGHASTHLLGTVLALSEHRDVSGAAMLEAYIAGREVRMHLNEYFDTGRFEGKGRGPGSRGWHATGTLGTLGSAAAASRVLGLPAEQAGVAIGISASMASALIANFGTKTKPTHAGIAARNGATAGLLAEAGIDSEPQVLAAPRGFTDAFCGPEEDWDAMEAVKTLTSSFHLATQGVRIKPYPSCSGSHPYIETIRLLAEREQISPADVAAIQCPPRPSLVRPYPKNGLECRFSAAFCMAATLLGDGVTLETTTDAYLARDDVQALIGRVEYVEGMGRELRVTTVDGRVIEQPLVPYRNLETDEERREKFFGCAEPVVGVRAARRIEEMVAGLEGLPSVRPLAAAIATAA